ncbi:hypothetical protein IL306_006323, partial [Fusarium sp. DS 682]
MAYQSSEGEQQIEDFLHGPDKECLYNTNCFLIHKYGVSLGELWKALAALKSDLPPPTIASNEGTPEVKRVRRSTVHEGYVDSASYRIQSSSPFKRSSSSSSDESSGPGYIDPKPTQDLPAEDSAVLLITRVLRHLVYYIQPHKCTPVVDFRHERQRMSLKIPGLDKPIIAIDDGGLSLFKVEAGTRPSTEPKVMLALLEAKRRLVVDDGKPVISDECLAQMTYEAILARARPDLEQIKNE